MTHFSYTDYRPLLKDSLLARKKQLPGTLTFQEMARLCRVHKAYLSKVLAGDGHLSADQLFHCCEYLGFTKVESRYVQAIFEYERSSSKTRRRLLLEEIETLRAEGTATEAHLEVEPSKAIASIDQEYYLDPNFQVVHMLLTIERYAKDAQVLASILRIDAQELARIIGRLSQQGIIALRDGKYEVVRDLLHLSQSDLVFPLHNRLLRLKSLERIQQPQSPRPYAFSATFSADEQSFATIRDAFMKFVKKAQKSVQGAEETRVYQMNFDLFSWDN